MEAGEASLARVVLSPDVAFRRKRRLAAALQTSRGALQDWRAARRVLGLREKFPEWFPVVFIPAFEEGLGVAVGEAAMVEGECSAGAVVGREFEFYDRVDAGVPVLGAPGLNDAFAGDEL